ncbi:uncharacterized protein LOC121887583 [Thunnus maccoyii]|uniref:uncharacterized protein LOC121887583 n=1 Tax=Thunnus maccoyii TaxID=8240 RepID=UPI001C4C3D0D|nr:uncharacterized protein LOC121887583 [Thunnus maccoyii]
MGQPLHSTGGNGHDLYHGKPFLMYSVPELYLAQDYHSVGCDRVDIILQENVCQWKTAIPCDLDLYEFCMLVMKENNIAQCHNALVAIRFNRDLRPSIRALLPHPDQTGQTGEETGSHGGGAKSLKCHQDKMRLLTELQDELDVDIDHSIMMGMGKVAKKVTEVCQQQTTGLDPLSCMKKNGCAEESHRGLQVILAMFHIYSKRTPAPST